ncbi:MFS transporter [Alicyclobacillus dauci]|uniref:MFS transporter n=1 Tax=Alicyclobacillus dauci TaxID=1475485 RepID=A0ABY6Z561_9BACL|nr:MFS transporter [Alicyclobacillus dauci]WAH37996.1 MFS transporter [Alicyclobacillus dauci]
MMLQTTEQRLKRIAYVTTTILFISWLIDYIDRLVITLALPSIGKQFHLNSVEEGAIMSIFFFTYAICQIPGGILADRFGAKKTMTVAMTAWSVFTALTGAAGNYVVLMIVRFFFGVSEGIFPGASMKAIAERTSQKARLTANGTMVASNSLGSALAPLIAAPAIAAVGWQHSFYWVAGLGIIMAVVLWFGLPKQTVTSIQGESTASHREYAGEHLSPAQVLRKGVMWKFFLMFMGMDIAAWGLVSWVPSYLMTQKHLSLSGAGVLTSIPFFAGTISTILGGWLFDKYFYRRHRWLIVPSMVLAGLFLFLMLSSNSLHEFIVYETIGAFCIYMAFQPIMGLPMRILSSKILGVGSAIVNFGGQVGGVLSPIVMGALVGSVSYQAAFGFLVFGVLLAAACSLWIPQSPEHFDTVISGNEVSQSLS